MNEDLIRSDFLDHYLPYLEGPTDDTKWFIRQAGELHCVRKTCEGCPLSEGCESEDSEALISPITLIRRMLSVENESFLVLKFKKGISFFDVPRHLLQNAREESLYEHNIHWLLQDFENDIFFIIKGQIRLYATEEFFYESEYKDYFYIYQYYSPDHLIVSIDYSAQEPRLSTLTLSDLSKESPGKWAVIFRGDPKPIFREIRIEGGGEIPEHVYEYGDRKFCYLMGELDKTEYESQCAKCQVKDRCRIINTHTRNIPGDWHATNRDALFRNNELKDIKRDPKTQRYVPANRDESRLLGDLRKLSKGVGLALTYGGTAFAISRSTGWSKEEAQQKIDSFFDELPDVANAMNSKKKNAMELGYVENLFGRRRSVLPDLELGGWKGRSYAERTALNHPIQSTASDIVKIGMMRVVDYIRESGQNFLYGLSAPSVLDPKKYTYREIGSALFSSVHDELVYMMKDENLLELVDQTHEIMQVQDLMDAWGSGFTFESDVEYDKTRSWTATEKMDAALIYLVRYLRKNSDKIDPNLFILPMDSVSIGLLRDVGNMVQKDGVYFGVRDEQGDVMTHPSCFDKDRLLGLQGKYGVVFESALKKV